MLPFRAKRILIDCLLVTSGLTSVVTAAASLNDHFADASASAPDARPGDGNNASGMPQDASAVESAPDATSGAAQAQQIPDTPATETGRNDSAISDPVVPGKTTDENSIEARRKEALQALSQRDYAKAFNALQILAQDGDAESAYWLADLFLQGKGIPRSARTGFSMMRELAMQGYAPAMARLPKLYRDGTGTKPDPTESARWLKAAALAGDAESQFALAMTRPGDDLKADSDAPTGTESIPATNNLLRMAAEQGYTPAQRELGLRLLGSGINGDPAPPAERCDRMRAALPWLYRAAQAGDPASQSQVGQVLLEMHALSAKRAAAAATASSGSTGSGNKRKRQNPTPSTALSDVSDMSDVQTNATVTCVPMDLGDAHSRPQTEYAPHADIVIPLPVGTGIEAGLQWLAVAAEQRNATALARLAEIFAEGLLLRRDRVMALALYNLAAVEQDIEPAQQIAQRQGLRTTLSIQDINKVNATELRLAKAGALRDAVRQGLAP